MNSDYIYFKPDSLRAGLNDTSNGCEVAVCGALTSTGKNLRGEVVFNLSPGKATWLQ